VARRDKSILEDLVAIPWWVNIILAIISYPLVKYWIPSITSASQNLFIKAVSIGAPHLAPVVALVFLVAAAASAFNAWRKGELLERQRGIGTLRTVSWQEFEELVGEAYRRKGFSVTKTGGGGADGGVDLVLRKGGEKFLVQCKHWRMDKVGVKLVRELYGVVMAESASGGILISSGSFTREAQDFAKGKPLDLLDGRQLIEVIEEVRKKAMPDGNKSDDNLCPLCGSAMVLRTAKRGVTVGERFWGCSAYPKCRGTKPYDV